MCGRFELLTVEEIAEVIAAVEGKRPYRPNAGNGDETAGFDSARARSQAHTGSAVPLIAPLDGGPLCATEAVWGFEADWNKRLVFNTRIESALSGAAMWREAAEDGRCIVPAAAFFEPHSFDTMPSPRTGRLVKRPYRFVDANGIPLLFAGVQADGRCSIVTCEPNRWVAPIHPRMPLALRFEEVATWLSPDWPMLADRSDLALDAHPKLFRPADQPEPPDQLSLF